MMRAAFEAAVDEAEKVGVTRPLILGVTVLTSMTKDDFVREGTAPPDSNDKFVSKIVANRGHLGQDAGLDGAVASPLEIAIIRKRCGSKFALVIPGIRPTASPKNDQERTGTPAGAINAGADYLVIGRPIIKASDPVLTVQAITEEIAAAMKERR